MLIAEVHVAADLGADQRRRLAAALSAAYGHDVHLNVVLDPEVIGGMSVRISDELIDGSVAPAWQHSGAGWPPERGAMPSREAHRRNDQDERDTKTMAELTIRPDEIRDALAEFVKAYEPAPPPPRRSAP